MQRLLTILQSPQFKLKLFEWLVFAHAMRIERDDLVCRKRNGPARVSEAFPKRITRSGYDCNEDGTLRKILANSTVSVF